MDEDDQSAEEPASTTVDLPLAEPLVPGEISETHIGGGVQSAPPMESQTFEETSQVQSTKLPLPVTSEPRHDSASLHETENSNAKDTAEATTLNTQDGIAQSTMVVDHPTVDAQLDSCTHDVSLSATVHTVSPPLVNVAPAQTHEKSPIPTTGAGTVTAEAPVNPSAAVPPMTEMNGLALPRLLFVVPGRTSPDVSDIVFEVDDALASATRRWTNRQTVHEYVFPPSAVSLAMASGGD